MKKIIAFVLTVAMVLSVCAFSVSAETAPAIVLEGADKYVAGQDYVVTVRINNAADVAGVQGELVYEGATFKSVLVNPQLQTWNNTTDDATIVNNDGDSVNFATLISGLTGTRILLKVTFTAGDAPKFSLNNVKFSDSAATLIADGVAGNALAPEEVVVSEDHKVELLGAGMYAHEDGKNALNQRFIIKGAIVVPETVTVKEYGVVFYPTQLLGGAALTKDTPNAIVASTSNTDEIADFMGQLKFGYTDSLKAAKMLGIKISAVVYYIDGDDEVHYSANSVADDKYIQGGQASKAILNAALDAVKDIEDADLAEAIAGINDENNMVANRNTILSFAIDHA